MKESKMLELNNKELRKFGLVTGGVTVLIFGIFLPWSFSFDYPVWPWVIFSVLGISALVAPNILRPVYKVWMRFGLAIGWVMNRVILTIIFFCIFTVVGLIMRITSGYDPMNKSLDQKVKSYRVNCDPNRLRKMDRQF
jgi:hypothetical protein